VFWFGGGNPVGQLAGRVLGSGTLQDRVAYNGTTPGIMEHTTSHIRVRIDQVERLLMFDYDPATREAVFDICDDHGHIVKSGQVNGQETHVRITDLDGEDYFLMVLDGETSTVKPFQLRKAS